MSGPGVGSQERSGGVAAYSTRVPTVLARLGFPGGGGSSRQRGAYHRTHGQSEESGLRQHRVRQTASQSDLRRTSWGLHRDLPCPSAPADAVFTDVGRAGRCFAEFDRLLLQGSASQVAPSITALICPSGAQRVWRDMPWDVALAAADIVHPAVLGHRFVRDVDGATPQQVRDELRCRPRVAMHGGKVEHRSRREGGRRQGRRRS